MSDPNDWVTVPENASPLQKDPGDWITVQPKKMVAAGGDPGDWIDVPEPEQQGPPSPPAFMTPGTVASTALGRLQAQRRGEDIPVAPAPHPTVMGMEIPNVPGLTGSRPPQPPQPPSALDRAVGQFGQILDTSVIPEDPRTTEALRMAQQHGGIAGHAAAAVAGVSNVGRALATPRNALIGVLASLAPPELAPMVSAYFASDMGQATLAEVPEIADAYSRGDTVTLTRLLAQMLPTAAMTGLAAGHAVHGGIHAGERAVERDARLRPGEQEEAAPGVNANDPMAQVRQYAQDQVSMGQGLDEAAAVKANAALPAERIRRHLATPVTPAAPEPAIVLGPDGRPAQPTAEPQMAPEEYRSAMQQADQHAQAQIQIDRKLDTLNRQLADLDQKISERFAVGQGTPDLPKSYPMPPAPSEATAPSALTPEHRAEVERQLAAEQASGNTYDPNEAASRVQDQIQSERRGQSPADIASRERFARQQEIATKARSGSATQAELDEFPGMANTGVEAGRREEATAGLDNPYDLPPDMARAVSRAKENLARMRAGSGPDVGLAIKHVDNLGNEHSLLTTKDHVEQLGASVLWRGIEDPRKWQNAMRREFGQNVFVATDAKGRKLLSPEKVYEGAKVKLAEHRDYAEGGEGLGLTTPKRWNDLLQKGLRSKDWYDANQDKLVAALGSVDRAVQQYRHQAAASPRIAVETSIGKTLDLIRAEVTGSEPPKGLLHKSGIAAAARGERPSGGKVGPYFDSLSEQLTKIPALETVVDTIISRAMGFDEHVSSGRRQFIDAANRMGARRNKLGLKQAQASTWTGFQDTKGETRAGMETKGDPYADQFLRQLDERGGAEKLYEKPDDGTAFEFGENAKPERGPNPEVGSVADEYNRSVGLPPNREVQSNRIDEVRAKAIARAYEDLPASDPRAKTAYDALKTEVAKQWDAAEKAGYHFEPWDREGQPYQNSAEMRADVRNNRHLYFFRGGEPHPFLNDVFKDGLTYNDAFRAVHDLFGHSKNGLEFGPKGEEAAWRTHVQMFTPEAAKAMTTETRGQNSWVNFGPHNPEALSMKDRPYAKQKAALLPDEFTRENAPLRLDHYSHERRDVLDPEFMDTNRAGEERKRSDRAKRLYYYPDGAKPEHGLGGVKHTVEVDPSRIYNLSTDPDGIVARERAKGSSLTEIENAVRGAGYTGYGANRSGGPEPEAYALFDRQHPLPDEPNDFIDMVEGMHERTRGQPGVGLGINVRSAQGLAKQRAGQKVVTAVGEPEEHFDRTAAFFGRYGKSGLRELESADPELARKFRAVPTAGGGAHDMTANFTRSLLKDGLKFDDFSRPLSESRLRGIQDLWQRNADEVKAMPPDDVLAKYGSGKGAQGYESLVRPLAGSPQFAKDGLLQKADAAFERDDGAALKQILTEAFQKAADNTAHVQTDAEFKASLADPRFKRALQRYKDTVEPVITESHLSNNGWLAKDLGPLDTYFPLSTPEPSLAGKLIRRRGAFAKPSNPWNNKATGLADEYDMRSEAFTGHLREGLRANSMADALRSAEDAGITRKFTADVMPPAFTWKGRDFVPEVHGNRIMPSWFKREVMPILGNESARWSNEKAQAVRNAVNFLGLVGPFDFVYHTTNLMGTGATRIPAQFRETAVSKIVGALPGIGGMPAMIYDTLATKTASPEFAKDVAKLRELGLLPDQYAQTTYSKKLAEEMGTKRKLLSFTPTLHGPAGIDVRSRVVFLRAAEKMKMTPEETYHFVNNLGNYTYQLNGSMARAIKKAGLSTFYTAGSGMNWNGVVAILNAQKLPASMSGRQAASVRMTQAITSGIVGATLVWALQYKAKTDQFPWEDPNMKLFRVPDGKDEKGTPKYTSILDLTNPLLSRGTRVTGIRGAAETLVRGGNAGQAIDAAKRDIVNSQLHPLAGPGGRVLSRGLFGIDPYIVSEHDDRGRPVTQFKPAVGKTEPGLPSIIERAKSAAEGVNPLSERLSNKFARDKKDQKSVSESMADVYLPRYFSKANPIKERVRLARERARAAHQ